MELWYFDFADAQARRITADNLNATLGSPFGWFRDSKSLYISVLPSDRPALTDTRKAIPSGPTVSVSQEGVQAQNRTYQDLLQNKIDEDNFDALVTSEIHKVDLSGRTEPFLSKDIYTRLAFSPDGSYLLVAKLRRPYSYSVPYSRFPTVTDIYDVSGKLLIHFHERPLIEALPKGFMATPGQENGTSAGGAINRLRSIG